MKNIKLFLGLIVLALIGLVIYQNRVFFSEEPALNLDLLLKSWHWTTSGINNISFWGGCFVIGLVISGFWGILSKLKSKKTIKTLNSTIESHLKMISSLKNELETLRNDPYKKTPDQLETQKKDETDKEETDKEETA